MNDNFDKGGVISDRQYVNGKVACLSKSTSIKRPRKKEKSDGLFIKSETVVLILVHFYKCLLGFITCVLFSIILYPINSHELFEAMPSVLVHTL